MFFTAPHCTHAAFVTCELPSSPRSHHGPPQRRTTPPRRQGGWQSAQGPPVRRPSMDTAASSESSAAAAPGPPPAAAAGDTLDRPPPKRGRAFFVSFRSPLSVASLFTLRKSKQTDVVISPSDICVSVCVCGVNVSQSVQCGVTVFAFKKSRQGSRAS